MKFRFLSVSVLLFIAVLYFLTLYAFSGREVINDAGSKEVSASTTRDTFTNCILNTDYNAMNNKPWLKLLDNLDYYKQLNFNTIQWYDWMGSDEYGNLNQNLTPTQRNNFKSAIQTVKNAGLLGYYERSNLSYYCYGQRLVYEVPSNITNDETSNYGFVYSKTNAGQITTDEGRSVIHAVPSTSLTAGYLCYDIFENLQHGDLFGFRQSDEGTWHIKPVMKIPQNLDDDLPVVRIDVIAFDSTVVKSIEIKVFNFKNNNIYNGEYIEEYFNMPPNNDLEILGNSGTGSLNQGYNNTWWDWDKTCHVDFRVYWYNQVAVWFDKMIVDDDRANDLFDPLKQPMINYRISDELNSFKDEEGNYSFFMDEVVTSQVPCLRYVMEKVRETTQGTRIPRLSVAFTDNLHIMSLKRDNLNYQIYYDSLKPSIVQDDVHKIEIWDETYVGIPNTITNYDPLLNHSWFVPPSVYNQRLQNKCLGYKGQTFGLNESASFISEIYKVRNYNPAGMEGIKFIVQPQIHGYLFQVPEISFYKGGLREPTNEEIQVQAAISIAHGAKGLCWYIYGSEKFLYNTLDNNNYWYNLIVKSWPITSGTLYQLSLLDLNSLPRTVNQYNQDKWAYVSEMNAKINSWLPVLENANWVEGFSVHHEGANHKYIEDIKSIFRDPSGVFNDGPSCPNCDNIKYWEEGFFEPKDNMNKSKYFLMVNRRCVPEIGQINAGDIRNLKIKFNADELPGFNNWKLINAENNSVMTTFNKNSNDFVDAGIFQPGEGKLFILAPVMQEGGTFVCDEEVLGQTFVCKADVSTSHYNLEINNSHIEFLTSVAIQAGISGGYDNELSISNSLLNGKNSVNWHGISGNYLYSVYLSNLQVSDIEGWAVNLSNCDVLCLQASTFNLNNTNSGAVALNNSIGAPTAIIWNNVFVTKSFTAAIAIFNSSGSEDYVTIYNNNISTVENGNNGIIITNSSGEIEYNTITGFSTGINLLACSFDVKDNNFTSGRNNSIGINATALSTLNLSTIGNAVFGGYNKISNYGTNCDNINVDNSCFASDIGYNEFNVDNVDGNYNFFGTGVFPKSEEFNVYEIPSRYNCFNGVNGTPRCSLRVPDHPIIYTLIGNPYYCNAEQNEDMLFTVQIAENFIDTVLRAPDSLDTKLTERQKLYKGVLINFRKHQYDSVSTKGSYYLSNYTDSVVAPDIISKLFYSASALDTAGERIQPLKTYFEQLIINNPGNPRLVKSAYYHVQKCKVYLEQYQSALAGFEDIIAQNPYGYEGLLASWDYAATLLLIDTIGAGGMSNKSELNEYLSETSTADFTVDSLRLKRLTKYDNYDKSVFIPNDRKTIIQNTATIFAEQRNKQIEKVKELEKKVSNNDGVDATRNKTELASMKALNEVVKIKRAKDQPDYMRLVTDDVNKVFKNTSDAGSNKTNVIPTSFELHQNYPNPFNPSTKIAFDLPKDAKVKLVIYDILGREIKTLIHNEFRTAGKYITEFNGSNLASGVYFYRLQAGDFVSVKKMVMIK